MLDEQKVQNLNNMTASSPNLIQNPSTSLQVSQDSRNMALLAWIGSIFFGFIPPLILMLVKTDDVFVQYHAKESLNLAITALFIYLICGVTSFLVLPLVLVVVFGIANFIFCIMASISASKGERYQVPMPMLRLVK